MLASRSRSTYPPSGVRSPSRPSGRKTRIMIRIANTIDCVQSLPGACHVSVLLKAWIIPISPEEAYHWNFARHLDWSYYDHPPLSFWIAWAAMKITGSDAVVGMVATLSKARHAMRLPTVVLLVGLMHGQSSPGVTSRVEQSRGVADRSAECPATRLEE